MAASTRGYPVLPALYVIIASAICVVLLIVKPATCGWGLAIVLLGIPVYFLWKKFGGEQTREISQDQ